MPSPLCFSISSMKYTTPYPVASGLIKDPPQDIPFPVNTPENSFFSLLYCPKRYPISLPPTPISPAGISLFGPICLKSSVIKL